MNVFQCSKGVAAYAALAFLLGVLFLFYQTKYPGCCDADQYVVLGKLYAEKGIIASSGDAAVRTYFYPLFVGYLYRMSVFLQLPLIMLVFFCQLSLYVFAVRKYASVIQAKLSILQIVRAALIFNLFAYPFFSLTLTDSIYNTLVILWIFSIIRVCNFGSLTAAGNQCLTMVALPGLLASIIFVVRPAGLWVVAAMAIMYIWLLFRTRGWKERIVTLTIIVGCMALPVTPQVYINLVNYGKATPFPTYNLGAAQLQWGIENVKYGTYLGGDNHQMFYRNPLYVSGQGVDWYIQNPVKAAGTMILKLVGAFDYDYLFPYVYEKKSWHNWPTGMVSLAVFLLGMWGMLVHAFRSEHSGLRIGPRFFPLICFLTWSGITLASAMELRFTLPMYAFFLPFTVERMFFLHRQWQSGGSLVKTWPILVGYALLIFLANYVRMQNVLF